jgi:putative (di)nucleoside polyphosphate hydrolase
MTLSRSVSASSATPARKTRDHDNKPSTNKATSSSTPKDLPELVMLLAEPEIRLVMAADRVDEHELLATLRAVSVHLKKQARRERREETSAHQQARNHAEGEYRPGVGIILLNERNEIFVGRRIDTPDAWQVPQGGIDPGETPHQAALRELKEEIGTDRVEVIAEGENWLYYDVPPELAQKAWQGRWKGQRQKWFVMLLKAPDADINLRTEHPEFDTWRWVPYAELSALAVSFKRQLYLNVLGEFATLFRD